MCPVLHADEAVSPSGISRARAYAAKHYVLFSDSSIPFSFQGNDGGMSRQGNVFAGNFRRAVQKVFSSYNQSQSGGDMKKALKTLVIGLLTMQMLTLPVMTSVLHAQVFDSPASGTPGFGSPAFPSAPLAAPPSGTEFPSYGAVQPGSYFTDDLGNILMYVNVWGEVGDPGHHVIREGSDLATVLSIVGGPTGDANLKKVRVNRFIPDENGARSYLVDLKKYEKEGDPAGFVDLKPNDTIIIPEDEGLDVGTVATIVGLLVSVATLVTISTD